MGEAGHIGAKFRRALDAGHFDAARTLAYELPPLSMVDALALTLLAAESGSAKFEPMARRWIARLLAETEPALHDLAIAVWVFEDVGEGRLAPSKARAPLERAAEGKRLG